MIPHQEYPENDLGCGGDNLAGESPDHNRILSLDMKPLDGDSVVPGSGLGLEK